jgi:hypothetical protein
MAASPRQRHGDAAQGVGTCDSAVGIIYKPTFVSVVGMTTKPGAVGANVAKFCRDTARLSVLDNDNKQTSVLRAVAGWHEKQVGALLLPMDITLPRCVQQRTHMLMRNFGIERSCAAARPRTPAALFSTVAEADRCAPRARFSCQASSNADSGRRVSRRSSRAKASSSCDAVRYNVSRMISEMQSFVQPAVRALSWHYQH